MKLIPLLLTLSPALVFSMAACTGAKFTGFTGKKKTNDGNGSGSASDSGGNGGVEGSDGEGSSTEASSGGNSGDNGGEGSSTEASGGTTPTVPINPDCKDADFITPDWPKPIADCVTQGRIYNFDKKRCSAVTRAEFTCSWDEALKAEKRVMRGDEPEQRIGSLNRQPWSKIVGCGELADRDYHILVLQYWTADNEKDLENCSMSEGWNIHTSCRIYKKSTEQADITWQNCLDYKP